MPDKLSECFVVRRHYYDGESVIYAVFECEKDAREWADKKGKDFGVKTCEFVHKKQPTIEE